MVKPPSSVAAAATAGGRGPVHNRTRLLLVLLVAVVASASTAGFLLRGALRDPSAAGSLLGFMRSKLVLLVSHELSLSGGPLLLMELAFLLRHVGSQVVWITNQRSEETNDVTYSLEHRMLNHGVQRGIHMCQCGFCITKDHGTPTKDVVTLIQSLDQGIVLNDLVNRN
ncbi:unnamed protein product [Miscanthus lutarioriparius]|uniref:Uncharacterized protein n=1 Tax=Miscanthus lutarioriparius TaxID=422564 RepID=A0A811PE58_9POAL|nr:unnamed protein product [Miscanthus lutarioriparius]